MGIMSKEEEIVKRWLWIANYCLRNRISPFDNWNYSKASREYDKLHSKELASECNQE